MIKVKILWNFSIKKKFAKYRVPKILCTYCKISCIIRIPDFSLLFEENTLFVRYSAHLNSITLKT